MQGWSHLWSSALKERSLCRVSGISPVPEEQGMREQGRRPSASQAWGWG